MSLNIHNHSIYKSMTIIGLLSIHMFALQAMPNKGIEFFTGSWPDALEMADERKRPIFVELYENGETPFYETSKGVFTEEEVGGFFNANFVNYKINIGSEECMIFTGKYNVDGVPSLLFFDPAGKILQRHIGQLTKVEILKAAEAINLKIQNWEYSESTTSSISFMDRSKFRRSKFDLALMNRQYDSKFRHEDFLYDFAYKLRENQRPYEKVVNEYLSKKEVKNNLKADRNRIFVYDFADDLSTDAANILVENKTWFERIYGVERINTKLKKAIAQHVKMAAAHRSEKMFKKALHLTSKATLPNKHVFLFNIKSTYYADMQDWENYKKTIQVYLDKYGSNDAEFLNAQAWDLMKSTTKKSDLILAKEWIDRSIKLNNQHYNNETLAFLLVKMGAKNAARKAAQEAIILGKINKDDITKVQALLKRLDNQKSVIDLYKL